MMNRVKTTLLSVLTAGFLVFSACESPQHVTTAPAATSPHVTVGFTTNLYGVQPHLAEGSAGLGEDIIRATRDAGFEYVELNTAEIAGLSDAEFEEAYQMIREIGLPVPVTNVFVPARIRLTGPDTSPEEQREYVGHALDRLQRLGVEYVVFGSGGARNVPDDFPREEAFQQLVAFSRLAAEEAAQRNIIILIEHLRRAETNIINSVAEGWELVQAVDHPNFQVMIDFYHFGIENEDPAIILDVADHLHHLHMANPAGREFPLRWDEHPLYVPFFQNLREIGYDGRISIESVTTDFGPDARRSIEMMHEAFDPDFPLPSQQ